MRFAMKSIRNLPRLLPLLALAVLALAALAVWGCTSSPTEPSNSGTPASPKPPDPVISYSISVTANPPEITAGSTGTSNITVQVRRADNGQPPPDLTKVTLTTNLGSFGSPGGPQTVTLDLVNGQAQAVLYAGSETGTATVRAEALGSGGAANVRIGQAATFFVSSVEPGVGNPNGGEEVTILGGGFQTPVRVTFNGATATVRSVTPNRIVVTTPSAAAAGVPVGVGQSASVTVAVTINVNEADQQTDSIDRGFTYASGGGVQQPQVFTLEPASGTNDGGTTVTIVGDGFVAPVQVLFGRGSAAASFNGVQAEIVSVTTNRIVVRTPAARGFGQNLTNQVVDVLVKNVNSGFSTVGLGQFKYGTNVDITAISQSSGPASGGTRVLIQGSGFDDPVTVSFHFRSGSSIAQQVVSVSGTQIVILTTPAPAPTACPADGIIGVDSITVTNIETGDTDTATIGFNFLLAVPAVTGVSPGSGASGSPLVITGQNFDPDPTQTEVVFGDPVNGSSAQIQGGSTSSSLRVIVPNAPVGFVFNTQACGINNGGTQNVPTPINITVRDLDSKCTATFRNGFLLTPPDGSCHQAPPAAPVAAFTAASISGNNVQFIDQSTGNPTSWSWDFGDGMTSTLRNPQHNYAAPGNYAVRLTVANAGGSNELVKVITVPTGP